MKKIDKIKKFYNKYIGINFYELIFLIIFIVFCFYDTGYTIYKPGGIVNVDTRITGDNLNETNGSFNMAYVSAMKGKTPIYLISKIMPNWELVKNSDMLPDNENIEDANMKDKLDYQEAMSNAKYVAFNKANVTYIQGLATYGILAVLGIPAKILSWVIGLIPVSFFSKVSTCTSLFASVAGYVFVFMAIRALCKDEKKIPVIMGLTYVAVSFATWIIRLMF